MDSRRPPPPSISRVQPVHQIDSRRPPPPSISRVQPVHQMDSRRPPPPPTCPSLPSSSAGDRSASKSCAACRFQRKRCKGDCLLAPFFPAADESKFLKAHRLQKILDSSGSRPLHQRAVCMETMIYDPATGCTDIILQLHSQIERKLKPLFILALLSSSDDNNFRRPSHLVHLAAMDGKIDTYRRPRLPEEWNSLISTIRQQSVC